MKILLDTHVWLWMLAEPERLGGTGRALLEDPANELLLSAASAWEISIKAAMGRIELFADAEESVPAMMAESGVRPLPVQPSHALRAGGLPSHHRDPFDRLLVAQSQLEDVPLMTADAALSLYEVEVVAP